MQWKTFLLTDLEERYRWRYPYYWWTIHHRCPIAVNCGKLKPNIKLRKPKANVYISVRKCCFFNLYLKSDNHHLRFPLPYRVPYLLVIELHYLYYTNLRSTQTEYNVGDLALYVRKTVNLIWTPDDFLFTRTFKFRGQYYWSEKYINLYGQNAQS